LEVSNGSIVEMNFLLDASQESLAHLLVYPNPYKKSAGAGGVNFDGLPPQSRVQIFSFSGGLVRELSSSDLGQTFWDVRNTGQEPVVTGLYFYVASHYDAGGWRYKKGKLAVLP